MSLLDCIQIKKIDKKTFRSFPLKKHAKHRKHANNSHKFFVFVRMKIRIIILKPEVALGIYRFKPSIYFALVSMHFSTKRRRKTFRISMFRLHSMQCIVVYPDLCALHRLLISQFSITLNLF